MKLKEIIEYTLWFIGIIAVFVVLYTWVQQPSGFNSGTTAYTKCLEITLQSGSIQDAEQFCKHLRK